MFLSILFLFELSYSGTDKEGYQFIFSTISGIFVGICTLLVITRFSSIIFRIPIWAIFFLSSYAIIQPVFPFLDGKIDIDDINKDKMKIVISTIALYGKLIFLVVVHWSKDTDRLFYYMLRAGNLYREENEEDFRKKIMVTLNTLQQEYENKSSE